MYEQLESNDSNQSYHVFFNFRFKDLLRLIYGVLENTYPNINFNLGKQDNVK